jgi:drug/metabolite transporter (DMT)-like permease
MKDDVRLTSARPLDVSAAVLMTFLCVAWGFNQVAVKLAIHDIPVLTQAVIRSAGGLVLVLGWARLRGIRLFERDGTLWLGIFIGLQFGFEFLFIYRGLVWTTATRAVLFLYTAPFFVAIGGRFLLPNENLGPLQWLGLLLSFAGIAVAMGMPDPNVTGWVLLGDVFLIIGGALWAATTLTIKSTRLARAPAEKTLAYQLAVSIPILAVGAATMGERVLHAPDAVATMWQLYQVFVVGVTFLVWFILVKNYSASRLSAFTFLTPLFGVAAGTFVGGETFSPGFAIAVGLVIAGLVLVNRRR